MEKGNINNKYFEYWQQIENNVNHAHKIYFDLRQLVNLFYC